MGLHVIQCHKLLVLTAATGLFNMMVKIKKTNIHNVCTSRPYTEECKTAKHAHCKMVVGTPT
jgi:hypothetical protein